MSTDDVSELNITVMLNRYRGKECTLLLPDGHSVTGIIFADTDYTKQLVQLVRVEKIVGKEMFDMIIPKTIIQGLIVRRPDDL